MALSREEIFKLAKERDIHKEWLLGIFIARLQSPLNKAAQKQHNKDLLYYTLTDNAEELSKLLTKRNVNYTYKISDDFFFKFSNYTLLELACNFKSINCLELLLQFENINLNSTKRKDKYNALIDACRNGYEEVVKLLLSRSDIDINVSGLHGKRPITESFDHSRVFKLLWKRKDLELPEPESDKKYLENFFSSFIRCNHLSVIESVCNEVSPLVITPESFVAFLYFVLKSHEGLEKRKDYNELTSSIIPKKIIILAEWLTNNDKNSTLDHLKKLIKIIEDKFQFLSPGDLQIINSLSDYINDISLVNTNSMRANFTENNTNILSQGF
ncbi:MAG: ankyrin repeat domain-containing protein [Sphingobacteriia bacterium]|nr:ankyrin repeat domain-containing protein [Sphingobacteriia bacterium]